MLTGLAGRAVDSVSVTSIESKDSNRDEARSLTGSSVSSVRPSGGMLKGKEWNEKEATSPTRIYSNIPGSATSPQNSGDKAPPKPSRTLPRKSKGLIQGSVLEKSDDIGGGGDDPDMAVSSSQGAAKPNSNKSIVTLPLSPKPVKVIHPQNQYGSSSNSSKNDAVPSVSTSPILRQSLVTSQLLPTRLKKPPPPPKPATRAKSVKETTRQIAQTPTEHEPHERTHEKKTSLQVEHSSSTLPHRSKTSLGRSVVNSSFSTSPKISPKPVLLPKPTPKPRVSQGTPEHAICGYN